MRITPTLLVCGALLSSSLAHAGPINIVLNPGFEQGALYWDYHEHFLFYDSGLWAHSDPGIARLTYCARLDCLDELQSGAYVGQLLATRPGDTYDLNFWARSFNGESRLSVWWDGALLSSTGLANGPMQQYTFSGLTASANATLLEVHGYNLGDRHLSLDDFSVFNTAQAGPITPTAPITPNLPIPLPPAPPTAPLEQSVPEPAVYALLLAALGAMGLARRRG